MMFEICRRHEELNYNIKFKKKVRFVGLHYIILLQCTVQKKQEVRIGLLSPTTLNTFRVWPYCCAVTFYEGILCPAMRSDLMDKVT